VTASDGARRSRDNQQQTACLSVNAPGSRSHDGSCEMGTADTSNAPAPIWLKRALSSGNDPTISGSA
jgi:hypothetical protein